MNQGLEATSENGGEVKHNYVIQAVFDLDFWPDCKTVNEETKGISWLMKWYTSETVALVKDTDKEDREKALKASWEANEPGRAEKAGASRRRFQLQKKKQAGEELTEEELDYLKMKRERVRKKDLEEQVAVKGAAKGKAPPKPDAKKPAKGHTPLHTEKVEEEVEVQRSVPEHGDHTNTGIQEFLIHFSNPRLLMVKAEAGAEPYMRSEEEKEQINTARADQRNAESAAYEQYVEDRNNLKVSRETFKDRLF